MASLLVTGATGFVGARLVSRALARGDEVAVLSRDAARAREVLGEGVTIVAPGAELPRGVEAVINLAGEPAVGARWTEARKREIERSRVETTARLVDCIARSHPRPRVLVSASGVGHYGALGDEPVDESARAGTDFLARVTVAWEAAARRAEGLGVRVVLARLGIVLGRGGGALPQMALPFRMFAGGPIGSGRQVVSWIGLDDAVRALLHAVDDDGLRGPVNVVAPGALTQAELAREIGRALGRPSAVPVPGFALRLRFGEGAEPLLTGQRAVPSALLERGFRFDQADLSRLLAAELR